MCRTRQQIIQDEPEVQDLIDLKEKIEQNEINGFDNGRKFYELVKIKSQIESTIREFQAQDDRKEMRTEINNLEASTKKGFEEHYKFHRKNPSVIALFKRCPTGMISFLGAGLVASSLFYVKETRDVLFGLAGLDTLTGQTLLNIGFPLFLFLLVTGIITFATVANKNGKKEKESAI